MAKKEEAPSLPQDYPLPLPEAVLRHHSETIFRAMRSWVAQDRVPPVLLLTGSAGVGKRAVVYFLAQWLTCERGPFARASAVSQEEEPSMGLFGGGATEEAPAAVPAVAAPDADAEPLPCGQCAACVRALKANWVDFTEISVDSGDGDSSHLKIDQFRKLKSTMGFGAFDGGYRITLIRDADRMTVQAANSLLKILEEPPPGWVFFLTASDPTLLLPTLVSRCQTLRLKPFTAEKLKYLLSASEVPRERQAVSAEAAQGSWKKALTFADDELWETRAQIFKFLESPQQELNGLVEWASQDARNLERLLDQMEQITSDLIRWSVSSEIDLAGTQDGKRSMSAHTGYAVKRLGSPARAREFWVSQAERMFRARSQLGLPLNRKLVIQDLLLPWLGL